MLKKVALWFAYFGLSYFVSDFLGWTGQGKAFVIINVASEICITLACIIYCMILGKKNGTEEYANKASFILLLFSARLIIIELFASWGATKLFGIDFYAAYQIMAFGVCLRPAKSKSSRDEEE